MSRAPHQLFVRVYWEDTDAGGIVYHASHIRFFERGRTEFLRALGISQSASLGCAAADALLFTVRHLAVDYLRPARLDDLLTVETTAIGGAGARLTLAQRLMRGEEEIARAEVEVAAVNGNARPRRIPSALLAGLLAES